MLLTALSFDAIRNGLKGGWYLAKLSASCAARLQNHVQASPMEKVAGDSLVPRSCFRYLLFKSTTFTKDYINDIAEVGY